MNAVQQSATKGVADASVQLPMTFSISRPVVRLYARRQATISVQNRWDQGPGRLAAALPLFSKLSFAARLSSLVGSPCDLSHVGRRHHVARPPLIRTAF
jgi:hypothetical protein